MLLPIRLLLTRRSFLQGPYYKQHDKQIAYRLSAVLTHTMRLFLLVQRELDISLICLLDALPTRNLGKHAAFVGPSYRRNEAPELLLRRLHVYLINYSLEHCL